MNNKKMTIFYKKRNMEIDRVGRGEQSLKLYASLDIEDAELIYGYIIIDYNPLILDYFEYYKIIENKDKTLEIELKEEYKDIFKQYM